jgi:hypothetical protein
MKATYSCSFRYFAVLLAMALSCALGVYFGQGNRLFRNKSDPNQFLLDFVGSPVELPAHMDAKYTKEGLNNAIQLASQNAGITLNKIEVDDSEFPFLVGVICSGSDMTKLIAEIKKMDGYHWGGSASSDNCMAFCIVPDKAYPGKARQQINRRLMLRYEAFREKLSHS